MAASFPVILPAIVIDSTNNAFEMTEHGVTETVFIEPNVYFLSGDEEADDLMTAFCAAANSHSNATDPNTYTKTGSFLDGNAANKSGGVTIGRDTGGSSFAFLFSHANTTFDAALLGFDPNADTANNVADKTGTLSPSGWWVCPEVIEEIEPEDEYDAWVTRTSSGAVYGGLRGPVLKALRLGFRFVAAERTHEDFNTADPDAAFSRMMARLVTGRHFELHLVDHAGGAITAFLDASSEYGDGWHLSQDDIDAGLRPERHSPAVDLYAWRLRPWGHVE